MKLINLLDSNTRTDSSLTLDFANEIKSGLSSANKSVSSKFLYDDIGSELFKKITKLDEYYLTRTEFEIINSFQEQLPKQVDCRALDIIELGVGDGHKSLQIVNFFNQSDCDVNYYPIDISTKAFELLQNNNRSYQYCNVTGIVADYLQGIDYTKEHSQHTKLVLFLGSNIGNFPRDKAQQFLSTIAKHLNPGDFILIGFDLKKDVKRLQAAYDDPQGITKAFNLNLLARINRELGGSFDLNTFTHHAIYNPRLSAMESHLLSQKKQKVAITDLGLAVSFEYLEPLHLEFSFKFNLSDIHDLAANSGFTLVHDFIDKNHDFVDSLWKVS